MEDLSDATQTKEEEKHSAQVASVDLGSARLCPHPQFVCARDTPFLEQQADYLLASEPS